MTYLLIILGCLLVGLGTWFACRLLGINEPEEDDEIGKYT